VGPGAGQLAPELELAGGGASAAQLAGHRADWIERQADPFALAFEQA
jgi:hypothetical protein